MCDMQWMNAGFAAGFGYGMPQHFLQPAYLAKLSEPGNTYAELRRTVANAFRNPSDADASQKPWPWIYGDAMDVPMPPIPRAMNSLTPTQLALLQYWADGQFVADYDPQAASPQLIEQLPLAEQPAMLDRAALEFCLADAFHPGCEMTWPPPSKPARCCKRAAGDWMSAVWTANGSCAPRGWARASEPRC
jgi:hypothetical protein